MSDTKAAQAPGPIVWMSLILLALCIVGTLVVVGISVVLGADELPAVYHSEGEAADRDLAALTLAQQHGLGGRISIRGRELRLTLVDRHGPVRGEQDLEVRLAHATRSGLDQLLRVTGSDGTLTGRLDEPLAQGDWLIEVRPDGAAWLLRGRAGPDGGRIGTEQP